MIKKCLFPAAGYGTRFLPATKAMPKEMLPVLTKPIPWGAVINLFIIVKLEVSVRTPVALSPAVVMEEFVMVVGEWSRYIA